RNGDLIYVGRVGGGFDDRMLVQVHKALVPLIIKERPFNGIPAEVRKPTWVEPRLVCEVRFNEWTSDKKLRAPVFQGFRDDIDPEQCRLEDSLPEKAAPSPLTQQDGKDNHASARKVRPDSSRNLVHKIDFTNLDKVFWPEDGYTKGDLIDYYDRVSPYLIPHLLDRPLVFERFPNGIHGESFYQKDAPDHTPG